MAGTIIYLVISFLVSLIFVVLGISQYKSEKPVSLNTGEKPPWADESIDVLEWNHKHGKNFIIYGCVLFLTLSAFVYFIEKYDYISVQIILFILVILGEVAWLEIQHNILKKKLIKNSSDKNWCFFYTKTWQFSVCGTGKQTLVNLKGTASWKN